MLRLFMKDQFLYTSTFLKGLEVTDLLVVADPNIGGTAAVQYPPAARGGGLSNQPLRMTSAEGTTAHLSEQLTREVSGRSAMEQDCVQQLVPLRNGGKLQSLASLSIPVASKDGFI